MPLWMIVVLFGVVLIVYAHIGMPKKRKESSSPTDSASETWLDAVSTTLQQMLDEWTEQHQAMKHQLEHMEQQWSKQAQRLTVRMEQLEYAERTRELSVSAQSFAPTQTVSERFIVPESTIDGIPPVREMTPTTGGEQGTSSSRPIIASIDVPRNISVPSSASEMERAIDTPAPPKVSRKKSRSTTKQSTAASVDPVIEVTTESAVLPSLRTKFQELFSLHDQGKSVEYIAKKLGKDKGEIILILRLAQAEGA